MYGLAAHRNSNLRELRGKPPKAIDAPVGVELRIEEVHSNLMEGEDAASGLKNPKPDKNTKNKQSGDMRPGKERGGPKAPEKGEARDRLAGLACQTA